MAGGSIESLPTMRIAGIVAFALGFQVGEGPKVKAKKSYSEIQKKLEKLLQTLEGVKKNREATEALFAETTQDDASIGRSLWALVDAGLANGANSRIGIPFPGGGGANRGANIEQVKTWYKGVLVNSLVNGGAGAMVAGNLLNAQDFQTYVGVANPLANGTVRNWLAQQANSKKKAIADSFEKKEFSGFVRLMRKTGFSPADLQKKDNAEIAKDYKEELKSMNENTQEGLSAAHWKVLNSTSTEKTYGVEEFTGATIEAANNSFWRRFEFKGEVEITWPVLDEMLRLGFVGGLSANLYKSTFKDRGDDLTDTAMFAFRLGGVVNITKWFEFCVLALAERHTLSKDKLTDDKDNANRKAYDKISSTLSDALSSLDNDDKIGAYLGAGKKAIDYVEELKKLQKDVDGEKDAWSVSGWSWGLELRAAVPVWLTENIAIKVGLAWKLPLSNIKKDDISLKPGQTLAPYIGVVFAI